MPANRSLTAQPDYQPDLAFGKLVELEGAANELREVVTQLEQRLVKCLRPEMPTKSCDPSNIQSIGDSEIGQQIGTVRGLVMQTKAHLQDIYARVDL